MEISYFTSHKYLQENLCPAFFLCSLSTSGTFWLCDGNSFTSTFHYLSLSFSFGCLVCLVHVCTNIAIQFRSFSHVAPFNRSGSVLSQRFCIRLKISIVFVVSARALHFKTVNEWNVQHQREKRNQRNFISVFSKLFLRLPLLLVLLIFHSIVFLST